MEDGVDEQVPARSDKDKWEGACLRPFGAGGMPFCVSGVEKPKLA